MTLKQAIAPLFFGLLVSSAPVLATANVAQQYEDSCAACHATGALNAPKTGDSATWKKLTAQKGMPALVDSVKEGMSQMPAGGLCSSCSDADYKALIEYMSK
ncbi:c-type cytochrome [Psychrobacter sp. FDAARGOS_221]|uniref:c-type cytochrome n=1 Tax=Psychrobacter sp. FDAARGOS_221 TaxID=1975705 RepID=UPI000BB585B5|nr:c-type cytochrome [Psychrobacter sp. FDAARGOS_221]PNK61272.1 cytochrome c5 family protein [Psychrobacter sp. FDAARGOS_221]